MTTLVDGDGTALVSDARTTLAVLTSIAAVELAATQDLPAMITEVRGALTVNQTIDQVSGDVTSSPAIWRR